MKGPVEMRVNYRDVISFDGLP